MKDNKWRAEWSGRGEAPQWTTRKTVRQEIESKQERLWGKHSSLVKSIKCVSILESETTEKFIDFT